MKLLLEKIKLALLKRTGIAQKKKCHETWISKGYRKMPRVTFVLQSHNKSLQILQSIEQNTANLYTVVDMISQSNDNQDKLIAIISEILMIAKAKEQAEADSLFKKAITAINDTVETAESIAKLYSWATMVYKIVTTTILK